jgi:hypothetical protein
MKRRNIRFYPVLAVAAMFLTAGRCGPNSRDVHTTEAGDSPIRVAGGSIIVHATQGWTPGTGKSFTTTLASKSYSEIIVGGFYTPGPPPDLPNLTYWQIDITDRSGSAKEGITLCSNPRCDSSTGPQAVRLKVKEASVNSDFYNQDVDVGGHGSDTAMFPGKRFFNSSCHTMSQKDDYADLCERISTIVVTIPAATHTYTCKEGECWILIKNSN